MVSNRLSRRDFFKWMMKASAVAGGAILIPPQIKTYFFLKENPYSVNSLLTVDWITKESLQILKKNFVFDQPYGRSTIRIGSGIHLLPGHKIDENENQS